MRFAILGFAVATATWLGTGGARSTHMHSSSAPRQSDRWSWHGRVASGHSIEIRNINGDVSAEAATGNEVEVSAIKRAGHRGDPEDVRIQEAEVDGDVVICVIYPNSSVDDGCRQRSGNHGNNRNDTEVNFTVRVPRGTAFSGNTVNGDVDASGLTAEAEAHSVNGSVRLETDGGDAVAESVNGSVTAVVHAIGQHALHFGSVNGAVNVTLPAGINADVEAQTVNGSIDSDFPISVTGRMSPRHLRGSIGSGGRRLELNTVNGSIRLRKLP